MEQGATIATSMRGGRLAGRAGAVDMLVPVLSSLLTTKVRQKILEQSKRANLGHIGSSLSIADLVTTLYDGVLRLGEPREERDRFVLSKGHAVLALYCALE